jgi:hypothetical protein
MKEEKRDYVSIVIVSTVRGINVVRINYSTLDCEEEQDLDIEETTPVIYFHALAEIGTP